MPSAPAFGSTAPNTTAPIARRHAAPAHIAHGSSVTTSMQSSSRHEPARGRGVAQREHLRVRGRVGGALALVVTAGEDVTVVEARDDRPDGHVAVLERGPGLVERDAHRARRRAPG